MQGPCEKGETVKLWTRLVPLGSHCVSAPWGGTLSTTKDVRSDVSVDARQKGGEPAEACNTTSSCLCPMWPAKVPT